MDRQLRNFTVALAILAAWVATCAVIGVAASLLISLVGKL
jgi:hypothetical protein